MREIETQPVEARVGRSSHLTGGRLALLASLAALGILATNIILPAFPVISRDLRAVPRELALTLSIFFVVFALGQLLVGPLADASGRRRFVLGGLALFVVGSVLCMTATTLTAMIAGRAVQAAGACATSVLARAIARDLYHGEELTRALSLVMIAMAAAPGFSPAIGTVMAASLGWRSIFGLVAVFGLVVGFYYMRSIGETLPGERRRPARPGETLLTYVGLIADRRFIAPAIAVSLIIGCLYSFFGTAPAILMTELGVSAGAMSLFFAATVFVVFGSGLMTARLSRRFGAGRVGMAGISMALVSGLWLLLDAATLQVVPFMAAVTLFLTGMGLVNPIGTALALEPFGDRAGAASALLGFLQMGCAAIGTSLVGILPLAPASAYAWIMLVSAIVAAASLAWIVAPVPEGSQSRMQR